MNRKKQTPRKQPTPDRIHFHFQWAGPGLIIHKSPVHLELYKLPAVLQKSLWEARPPSTDHDDGLGRSPDIPVGSLAQMLHRAPWGNLSLNFEPGPHAELMLYISLDNVHPDYSGAPMTVAVAAHGKYSSPVPFRRAKYSSPALAAGRYVFAVARDGAVLTEVVVRVDGRGDLPSH